MTKGAAYQDKTERNIRIRPWPHSGSSIDGDFRDWQVAAEEAGLSGMRRAKPPADQGKEAPRQVLGCWALGICAFVVSSGIVTGLCYMAREILPDDKLARIAFVALLNTMCVFPVVWYSAWRYAGKWAVRVGIESCAILGALTAGPLIQDTELMCGWIAAWLPSWITLYLLRREAIQGRGQIQS